MKRAVAAFALATFAWAGPVWADEDVTAPADTPATSTKPGESSSGEITLENAAVNRAFAGVEAPVPSVPVRPHRFGVYLGMRATNLKHPGYDPYSSSDALVQNAVGLSFSPWRARPLSLHFLAEWNYGMSNSYARGIQTNLAVHRLALGLEGRWMPGSRFYLFGKLVPGLVHLGGEIDDYELGVTLESNAWAFVMDASAGAALRIGTAGTEPKRTVSFWLMMDWGYTFAAQAPMTFRPADIEDDTRTFGTVSLPGLRPGGFVTRTAFAITF